MQHTCVSSLGGLDAGGECFGFRHGMKEYTGARKGDNGGRGWFVGKFFGGERA